VRHAHNRTGADRGLPIIFLLLTLGTFASRAGRLIDNIILPAVKNLKSQMNGMRRCL
jgi:hypothetical protein